MNGPVSLRLLNTGSVLASQHALDELTPELIADVIGLSAGQFATQFGSVDGYLLELNQQFLDYIAARLLRENGGGASGLSRLCRATSLQLDICLEHRALQNLLAEARRDMPLVGRAFQRRDHSLSLTTSAALKTLGCANAASIARVYHLMVLETIRIEGENGAPNPALRCALDGFLANAVPASPVGFAIAKAA